jgi:hypothetical protein
MHTQKIFKVLQSFVLIPMIAIASPLTNQADLEKPTADIVSISSESSVITTQEDESREKAEAIDNYFASKGAPLSGYGINFVKEAEKNGLDWRLLPAIAMRESTGGKFACKSVNAPNNSFGWYSCKKGFDSVEESIEYISKTISGNNEKATSYNKDMTTEQILKTYNPDSIVPGYSKQVMKIMDSIGSLNEKI